MYNDTIAAISTPVGEGGIGIVRLSGPRALEILQAVFVPGRRPASRVGAPRLPAVDDRGSSRRLRYGHVVDAECGEVVDEVLAVALPSPGTYTREDMVEINCHGGVVPLQRVLGLCLRHGARLAGPGEFTARAFLSGRLTLDQAEAVLDVVQARTEVALSLAMQQLGGRLAAEVGAARRSVLAVLAYLTATIDFPEDEVPPEEIVPRVEEVRLSVGRLLQGAKQGLVYRQGVRTAIVGRPNVGKSSLLNALLKANRAIVTPVPGTTRDTIEETLSLRGLPLVLIDTAGIVATDDMVERLGVERSRQAIAAAALVIFVLDGSQPVTHYDEEIGAGLAGRAVLLAVNKADLEQRLDDRAAERLLAGAPVCHVSALTGAGMDRLESAIEALVLGGAVTSADTLLVTNPRHQDALRRAAESLASAAAGLAGGAYADCVTLDLATAANALGEVTGETAGEDLLDAIFSRFCIGK